MTEHHYVPELAFWTEIMRQLLLIRQLCNWSTCWQTLHWAVIINAALFCVLWIVVHSELLWLISNQGMGAGSRMEINSVLPYVTYWLWPLNVTLYRAVCYIQFDSQSVSVLLLLSPCFHLSLWFNTVHLFRTDDRQITPIISIVSTVNNNLHKVTQSCV